MVFYKKEIRRLKMSVGVKRIIFIILSIFLLKLSIADPLRERRNADKFNASATTSSSDTTWP